MATPTTTLSSGVITTSMFNTPQAKDDVYSYTEDTIGIVMFDVMANDLGGAAKQLWSITAGTESQVVVSTSATSAYQDLISKDAAVSSILDTTGWETSTLGARIAIYNGQIAYDASSSAAINALGAGQTTTDTITYAIRLGNGTISLATMSVTITGSNDAVTIVAATTDANGAVTEDSNSDTLSDTGVIAFNDVDLTDTHTATAEASVSNVLGGTLTMGLVTEAANTTGGTVGWTYNVANSATQYLALGQTATESFVVTISDGNGGSVQQTVTITITGTNDAPVITVGGDDSASGNIDETNSGLSTSGTLTVNDVDTADTVTVAVTGITVAGDQGGLSDIDLQGFLTLTAGSIAANTGHSNNINWSFDSSTEAFNFLSAGETLTLTYEVVATDNSSAATNTSNVQQITITITGTNDAAVVSSADVSLAETNAALTTGGTLTSTDVDNPDNAFTPSSTAGTLGSFAIDAGGNWTFTANSAFDELNTTSTPLTETFNVSSIDGTPSTVKITITGTNDAPTIAAVTDGALADTSAIDTFLDVTGNLDGDDVDSGAILTYALVGDGLSDYGTLTVEADGAYTFVPDAAAINALAADETDGVSFNVTVTDEHGAFATTSITFNLTGSNDAPTIAAVTDGALADTSAIDTFLDVTGNLDGDDVDSGAILTYALVGDGLSDYGTLTVEADGAYTFVPNAAAINALAADATDSVSFDVTVTDEHGASATTSMTFNLTGSNDAPVLDNAITDQNSDEDQAFGYTVPANAFSDVDSNTLTYAATMGDDNALPSWLSFDGTTRSFSGTPPLNYNGSFDVKVTASDGALTASDTFTLTINPVNDAPVAGDDTLAAVGEDSGVRIITFAELLSNDSKGPANESTQTLTITAVSNAVGGTVAIVGGAIQFTPTLNFNGAASFDYTVSDNGTTNGAADPLTDIGHVSFTINAVNDAASISGNALGSVTEDGTLIAGGTLTVLDVDAGQALFQTPGNLAGTYGTFTFNAGTGVWGYTLNNAAANVQALNATDHPTNTLTVTSFDGTASQIIVVTINGANDNVDPGGPTAINFAVTISNGNLTTLGNFVATGDPDDTSFVYSLQLPVAGITIDSATGALTTGFDLNASITVIASDNSGNSTSATFQIITGSNGNTDNTLNGTSGTDILAGYNGEDTLLGTSGNDYLLGGSRGDFLSGGLGNDVLLGGGGNDQYLFNTALNASTNVDKILVFNGGGDIIQLDDAIFANVGSTLTAGEFFSVGSGLGATAVITSAGIIADANGSLYYDTNGGDSVGRTLFATATVSGTLDHTDFQIV